MISGCQIISIACCASAPGGFHPDRLPVFSLETRHGSAVLLRLGLTVIGAADGLWIAFIGARGFYPPDAVRGTLRLLVEDGTGGGLDWLVR